MAAPTLSGMSADYKRGTPFTLSDEGTASGVPGAEVIQSSTVTIPAGMTAQWVRFTAPQTTLSLYVSQMH